ncbi:flavin reductase family protein [Ramlibacter sp. AW1]|uniref:Flavin reductase family protein n=1 Tax=Ramlibacter aurantiacus TaxID=2801330 RepID=A0A937D6B8_9BURK|nr:flavin reductase family protein [Ramlibacter aurantiacus]MBL0419646.1 flavin reductase family protein [Ramlibacter aurantiacus]
MFAWAPAAIDAPAHDHSLLRRALATFPTGVCLVTTVSDAGKREGMTINSFASVSMSPPLILWSIRDEARSADAFLTCRHFCVSVLSAAQRDLAMHFARPAPDKFADCEDRFQPGFGGCPVLREAAANFECSTYSRYLEGDHTILLGRVERFSSQPAASLVFHSGQMGSVWELAASLPQPSQAI